jgi:hypothetical protein
MEQVVTFEKDLAPGVRVWIEHVPAIVRGTENKEQRLFTRRTAARIETLLSLARHRMATGEKEIRLDFQDDSEHPQLCIAFSSSAADGDSLETYRQAFDRITCAFNNWAVNTHTKVNDTTADSLTIALYFDKGEINQIRRLTNLRDAIMHFASAKTPLVADEGTLSIVHCLAPHRGTSYDRVRLWLSSEPVVELTEQSRDLILQSWLQARRRFSEQARLESLQGTLHAVIAGNILVMQLSGFGRKSRFRYQPALGIMARDYLGSKVNLTCIVDVYRGKARYEAIEMEPV